MDKRGRGRPRYSRPGGRRYIHAITKTRGHGTSTFASLKILAVAVEGNQEQQTFTVNYTDGTSSSFTQSLSDWAEPGNLSDESVATEMPYRLTAEGSKDANTFYAHAYSFSLDSSKVTSSVNLPANANVLVLAATLVPSVK